MKPAPFDYQRAGHLDEATAALAEYGQDARILAGGQSLIAMLNMRLAEPKLLIDISRTRSANYVRRENGHIVIGCAATQASLERFPDLAKLAPLVAKALPHTGHFQTRNKGTICGSIAHADPSSELPLCAAVLGAEICLRRKKGSRIVKGHGFFTGLLQTVRQPDEIISEVRLPIVPSGEAYAFREMALRHGDFAIIAVAIRAKPGGLTIGIGGASDRPHVRDWPMLEGSGLTDALNALAWELDFQDDAHAGSAYRRHLVRELGRKAVEEARSCLA
jgi:2-furoyl-CoA dehydrogenase FAD binding subunit